MTKIQMEVCCYNLESALNAEEGGADRIELCADRFQGGTTPSYGMLEVVKSRLTIPVFSMIRPRGGDFLYSKEEIEVMIYDIQMAKELGIDGVVIGGLTADGAVDTTLTKALVDAAEPMKVTFHRAFDMTPDPFASLKKLIELGVDRVLTSGQRNSAFDGRDVIEQLVVLAKDAIAIMPGAGISEDNLLELLQHTGAKEFHVSASGSRPSLMQYQKQEVLMGDDSSEYEVDLADISRIRKFRELRDQVADGN